MTIHVFAKMQWWRARSLAVSKWCLPRSSCRVVAVFRDASTAERHHKGPSANVEVPFKAGHAMSGDDERQGLLTTGANRKANPVSYTISEPTRLGMISYAVFCLKKKKTKKKNKKKHGVSSA